MPDWYVRQAADVMMTTLCLARLLNFFFLEVKNVSDSRLLPSRHPRAKGEHAAFSFTSLPRFQFPPTTARAFAGLTPVILTGIGQRASLAASATKAMRSQDGLEVVLEIKFRNSIAGRISRLSLTDSCVEIKTLNSLFLSELACLCPRARTPFH